MSTESHAIAWIPVLDRIEQRLVETLAQAVLPDPAPQTTQHPASKPLALARLDDHVGQVQQRFVSIAAEAADTDALLASAAMDLRQWLDHFATSRQQLTDWAASLGSGGVITGGPASVEA